MTKHMLFRDALPHYAASQCSFATEVEKGNGLMHWPRLLKAKLGHADGRRRSFRRWSEGRW